MARKNQPKTTPETNDVEQTELSADVVYVGPAGAIEHDGEVLQPGTPVSNFTQEQLERYYAKGWVIQAFAPPPPKDDDGDSGNNNTGNSEQ